MRNGPDLSRFHAVDPDPSLKRGKRFLLAYAGVMGRQDGIDHALGALAALRRRRDDWHAVLAGDGEVLPRMRDLARRLGIGEPSRSRAGSANEGLLPVLSTADVGLAPDPPSPAKDADHDQDHGVHGAWGCPSSRLRPPRVAVSAGPAARFAAGDDEHWRGSIDELLDDPAARAAMGDAGRGGSPMAWPGSTPSAVLHQAYDRVLSM